MAGTNVKGSIAVLSDDGTQAEGHAICASGETPLVGYLAVPTEHELGFPTHDMAAVHEQILQTDKCVSKPGKALPYLEDLTINIPPAGEDGNFSAMCRGEFYAGNYQGSGGTFQDLIKVIEGEVETACGLIPASTPPVKLPSGSLLKKA